jgi:glycerol-3-phosphate acyltransferase PlsY
VTAELIGLAIGAAVGSVPFAWVLHRVATGRDLRGEGSGNPGAANLERADGARWGALALALDAGKGSAAVLISARVLGDGACVPAAIGAVCGHVFSPWLLGRGGKGVATAAGAYAVLAPAATAVSAAVFVVVVFATRLVSLGSVLAVAVLPFAVALTGPGGEAAAGAVAIGTMIAWRHRGNFARMREGTEPRLGRPPRSRRGNRG